MKKKITEAEKMALIIKEQERLTLENRIRSSLKEAEESLRLSNESLKMTQEFFITVLYRIPGYMKLPYRYGIVASEVKGNANQHLKQFLNIHIN